jgi:hypothetical protein
MNTKSLLQTAAVTLGAIGVLATAGAASASAATVHPLTAKTQITNRLDGGGNGSWAYDTFNRVLSLQYLGKSADPAHATAPYMYDAQVRDTGTFKDIPGKYTPDQGGKDLGLILKPNQVTGTMEGSGQWGVFYASSKDARGLVPSHLNGPALNTLYPSSTWPELAFPQGTVFNGVSEFNYSYEYTVPATTVTHNGHKHVYKAQTWLDTASNGDGQLSHADGNITGR